MKNKKVIFILFFVFVCIIFLFIFNSIKADKDDIENNTKHIDLISQDNSNDSNQDIVSSVKNTDEYDEPIEYQNKILESNDNDKKFIDTIIKKFKDDKKFVDKEGNNFLQISDNTIIGGEIAKNQCLLNIVYEDSDLSVCDFVRGECVDIGCDDFDCKEDKSGWYRVSYYGPFVGSSDKELVIKRDNKIVIANLECDDKTKESYENELFKELVADQPN